MSVPVNQRSHGKLEAYAKAYELATYTLKITKNKKIFTEEYQDCLTDHIISAALDIYMCTGTANGKQVRTEKDKVDESYAAWRNHASKGNSFRLLQRMDEYYKNLWR